MLCFNVIDWRIQLELPRARCHTGGVLLRLRGNSADQRLRAITTAQWQVLTALWLTRDVCHDSYDASHDASR